MLMPAVGFDVVPSDCMASWVVARLPSASELSIGISGLDAITRGSAESVLQVSDGSIPVRRGGKLVQVPPGAVEHDFDFGHGTTRGTAIPWADVVTAYHSTRVPNITAYYEATPLVRLAMAMIGTSGSLLKLPPWKSWFQAGVRSLPDGPDEKYRQRQRAVIVVTARDPAGRTVSARVETPEVYSFTATTAVSIADRVLHGDFRTGFQTPACVYGPDLLFALPGVTRTLLA
jgi:short subunit dehydrogenase-like uncharacterized protein